MDRNHTLATIWTGLADQHVGNARIEALFVARGEASAHVVSYYRHQEQVCLGRALEFVEVAA